GRRPAAGDIRGADREHPGIACGGEGGLRGSAVRSARCGNRLAQRPRGFPQDAIAVTTPAQVTQSLDLATSTSQDWPDFPDAQPLELHRHLVAAKLDPGPSPGEGLVEREIVRCLGTAGNRDGTYR